MQSPLKQLLHLNDRDKVLHETLKPRNQSYLKSIEMNNNLKILIVSIMYLITLISCEKKDEYKNDGEVSFYTNAQAFLNCGEFDVDVYIDSIKIGVLSKPLPILATDKQPDCGDPLTLTIKKKTGEYVYSAEGKCGSNLKWEGDFQIMKDSCTKIFLNITDIIN